MRLIGLSLLLAFCIGCGSSSTEEKEAAQALQPKPQTQEQKDMLEKITKNPPPSGGPSGGR